MALLSPAQNAAYHWLADSLKKYELVRFYGRSGHGNSTVLRELHRTHGGAFLTMRDYLAAMATQHPLAIEETFANVVRDALISNHLVILDDLDPLNTVISPHCGGYPRPHYGGLQLSTLVEYARSAKKKMVCSVSQLGSSEFEARCDDIGMPKYTPADLEFLFRLYLRPEIASRLNYNKVFRFAPKLDAHQIVHACTEHWDNDKLETDSLIEFLKSQGMTSNIDLGEVRPVQLHELRGVEDVVAALEANIILPLENDKLIEELNLKPKRGVLLAGPPGTGKTTVGRALAHRLKGKFFHIDGTYIAGTQTFYHSVNRVFEQAKENAPAVIFIDDSDVIFEDGEEAGLYRYLLTMLDGLESESAGRVCVMLTAMDVGALPPALVRSGRVELWLEMRLPDMKARAEILHDICQKLPATLAAEALDFDQISNATDGFTGADLTRLVEDAKMLYAFDRARNLELKTLTAYFLAAGEGVRANKRLYEQADSRSRQQHLRHLRDE